jgi:hypothetical protein
LFVIPTKYSQTSNFVVQLVEDIRMFHPDDRIVVVDSASEDRSYFPAVRHLGAEVEDVGNQNWMVGAYWHAYTRYPDEPFYFFMHDSMRVKANLHHLMSSDVTTLCHFDRTIGNFNSWADRITAGSRYTYRKRGRGCYGPIFFCRNEVMARMQEMGAHLFLPTTKEETGFCEGAYGFFLEEQGYDLRKCSLFGDVLKNESRKGRSGPAPHYTAWQWPVEKFYASHRDLGRH